MKPKTLTPSSGLSNYIKIENHLGQRVFALCKTNYNNIFFCSLILQMCSVVLMQTTVTSLLLVCSKTFVNDIILKLKVICFHFHRFLHLRTEDYSSHTAHSTFSGSQVEDRSQSQLTLGEGGEHTLPQITANQPFTLITAFTLECPINLNSTNHVQTVGGNCRTWREPMSTQENKSTQMDWN